MIGKNVRHAYKMMHSPIQAVTTLKIVGWTPNKNTERPEKNRKKEIWRSAGRASTVQGIRSFSTPCL
jgi:hypothetical protein